MLAAHPCTGGESDRVTAVGHSFPRATPVAIMISILSLLMNRFSPQTLHANAARVVPLSVSESFCAGLAPRFAGKGGIEATVSSTGKCFASLLRENQQECINAE